MLRSYRGIVAAFIGLILAAASPPGQGGQGEQAKGSTAAEQSLKDIAAALQDANKADHTAEPCPKNQDDRTSDLCAQWKAADAAVDAAWWAAVAGFAGAISTLLVLIALYLAFRSNWIARDTAKRQLRAYIGITDIRQGTFAKGMRYWINPAIYNKGQTPAYKVIVRAFISRRSLPLDKRSLIETPVKGGISLVTLPAGEPMSISVEFDHVLSAEEIVEFNAGKISYFLHGRINYTDIFGDAHVTHFRSERMRNGTFSNCYEGNDAT